MPSLDNPKLIERYDKEGMLRILESFPAQCSSAMMIGLRAAIPGCSKKEYRNVVCTGLGGSAIGADIVRSYSAGESPVPVFVNRDYSLPNFVDSNSLVIASSYSGNTEETLSAYNDAKSRKAGIVVVTSGGELKKLSSKDGFPAVVIPQGLPPRAALGYSFFTILAILSKVGIVGDRSADAKEAVGNLERLLTEELGPAVPVERNIAKKTALAIYKRYPVTYGASVHIDSVVMRWRGQLAENSKTLSSSHTFPEVCHNEIAGWEEPGRVLKDFAVIMLRDRDDHPRVSKRMDVVKKIVAGKKVPVIEVNSIGGGLLSRIFSLIYIGDFVSFYLAMLNKVDPAAIENITYLKKEMSKA